MMTGRSDRYGALARPLLATVLLALTLGTALGETKLRPSLSAAGTVRAQHQDVSRIGGLRGASGEIADDGVGAALQRSFSLAAALERANAAGHEAGAAARAMLPRLSLLATLDMDDDLDGWRAEPEARVGVRMALPLFASGANVARLRAARAARDAADYGVLAQERAVALETVTARLEVSLLTATLRALDESARGMADILRTTETLRRAGEAGLADEAFARANLEAARAETSATRTALEEARLDHRTLTGGDARPVRAGAFDHLVPGDAEAMVAAAVRRSPEVLAGFRNADARRHAARAALGDLGPRLDLTASASHDYDFERGYDPDDWRAGVGLQLSVPVLDLESRSRARASRAVAREAEWRARDAARTAERRARAALIAHRGAGERAAAARRRLAALEGALAATRAEYRMGLKPVTDVTRVQLDLARARIDLAGIVRDRARAAYLIGILTGRALDDARIPRLSLATN